MALTMYMKVTGKNQGEIKGSCDQAGDKKDKILVYAMDHKVEIPRDTHTGLPTGQRIHLPLSVVKAKDVASPKLFAACCKGEQVAMELDYYRIKPTGEEELYYKVILEDAVIVEMSEDTPLTFLPENKPYHDMETVAFTYSKITWSYTDGNIEFTDNWKA
jgi:type VI secretion system secreted protein Hcp